MSRRAALLKKYFLAVLAAMAPVLSIAQTNSLTFRPLAAEYSTALDRIIMISTGPDQLHIYDAGLQTDVPINLPKPPYSVSVSPDGLHAAVGHDALISYVNLVSQTVEKTLPVSVVAQSVVLSTSWIYTLPTYQGSSVSVNIATGSVTANTSVFFAGAGRLNPAVNSIYGTRDGTSPNDIEKYDISTGPITAQSDSPYHGDYPICGPVFFSPDGARIYDGCGTVFRASTDPKLDMLYVTSLASTPSLRSLSESAAAKRVALIQGSPYYGTPPNDGVVLLLESDYLKLVGQFTLPDFVAGLNNFKAHGKWVFFNSASTALYVVMQADASSGLLNDFAVQRISLSPPVLCGATLASASANVIAAGSLGTVNIAAEAGCQYQAVSNASWIETVSGSYGSGNGTLTYMVRANPGSTARTGTISMGAFTFTVNQDGASAPSSFTRLAYNVIDVAYDKALDKLVLVAANPNELHVYDPVTLSDQLVPLKSPPLSVSVSPDGLHAAVGHDGWVSYINLQTPGMEKIVQVITDVHTLVLAGNGYVYLFPARDWSDIYSLQVATEVWTATSAIYEGRVPRLRPGSNYMYVGGNWFSKWDISKGVAQIVSIPFNSVSTCGNLWFSDSGTRFFTACGTVYRASDVPSEDLQYNGQLSGLTGLVWAGHSGLQQSVAVIPTSGYQQPGGDTQLQIFGDAYLGFAGTLTLPQFTVSGTPYAGHGKFVFWNSAQNKLFVVMKADDTANLSSAFAVKVVAPSSASDGCSFSLAPTLVSEAAGGGFGSITLTTGSSCVWTATSGAAWLTISAGSFGFGPGSVAFSVAPNSSGSRSTTLTIAGQTLAVTQAGASCTYSLNPSSVSFTSAGGSGGFTVTTSSCVWTAVSNNNWITVTTGSSGAGSGSVTYSVSANTGAARSGTITAGGQTFTVSEAGTTGSSTGLRFVPVAPCRIMDTRSPAGPFGGPSIAGNSTRNVTIPASSCGIPSTAAAYSLNVTVVPQGPLGYLTLWPAGQAQPFVSTLNSFDGRIKANAAIVPASASGAVSVFVTNTTDVVLDINGYFVPASGNNNLAFYPVAPCRVADTRSPAGPFGGPSMAGGQVRSFAIPNTGCGIPFSAQAYSLNMTVVPGGALSYLTTWPTGQAQPFVSTLNSLTGTVTANAAIVPAGSNGAVSVFATNPTDVVIDINGYFAPPGSPGELLFYPVSPCRISDTRSPAGPLGGPSMISGQARLYPITSSSCGLPASAKAYSLNATVVPRAALSYLTLWPSGQVQPFVSTLNSFDGSVVANAAIVPAGSSGSVTAYVTDLTDLILDTNGYFAP